MSDLRDNLEFIDLSTVSFKNVDIRGISFKGSNIKLFPQEVYKKDLRNCDFTGINLSPFMDFRGVDIRGAKFSADNDITTLDINCADRLLDGQNRFLLDELVMQKGDKDLGRIY